MRNMKKLFAFLSVCVVSVFFIGAIATFAADPCYVTVNGSKLTFDDVEPQIINNRVMVPFRKTAETLGAIVDWNSTTETMTLTKGNRVVVHTLRSNVITINGDATTFDTPSMVANNRTIMPLRMLAEALGCEVEWKNEIRTAVIVTEEPTVESIYMDKTLSNSGEQVNIYVNASGNTDRVKIFESTENVLIAESFTYTTNADNTRLFTVPWTPYVTASLTKNLKAYAGDAMGYNEKDSAVKTCITTITIDNSPKIKNVRVDSKSVDQNDYVTITAYTNSAADRVIAVNNFKSTQTEISNYTISGEDRVFEARIKMSSKGDFEFRVSAGNSEGYQPEYETINITVGKGKTSSSSKDKELEIIDVDYDSSVAVGENAIITVTTTYDVERIEIYDEDDKRILKKNFPTTTSKSDNEKTWRCEFEVSRKDKRKYTVKAFDDDDESTSERINITGDSYNDKDVYILSITQKTENASVGDTVRFTAKTTSVVDYVIVKDNNGNELEKVTSSGSSNTWSFSVEVKSESKNNFTLYAYSDDGDVTSKKFSADIYVSEQPKIVSVDIAHKTVEEGDDIEVDVSTNTAVTRIWIEDERGRKVSKTKKSYDRKDGDEYVWEFEFEAEDKGSYVYTIMAENEDGDYDDWDFNIKVTR